MTKNNKNAHMKKEYWINVKHVDNRLVIFLNGETVWDSGIVHGDPEINQFINITDLLQEHPEYSSELIFEGFNDTYNSNGINDQLNPWHFQYRVFAKTIDDNGRVVREIDLVRPYNERHLSNPNIKAIDNSYQLAMKEEGFKVISHSLSQRYCQ
jgi:hypothetical protein